MKAGRKAGPYGGPVGGLVGIEATGPSVGAVVGADWGCGKGGGGRKWGNRMDWRAFVGDFGCGRVVRMTPRCLARFQSFPDEYELPSQGLAGKVIGMAVPPLMCQRIVERFGFLEG